MSRRPGRARALYAASITHERGVERYVATTEPGLLAQIAGFCREHWDSERQRHPGLPERAPEQDVEAIATYFDAVSEEQLDHGEALLAGEPCPRALDDGALVDAHAGLQRVVASLTRQLGTLAAERARRMIVHHAPEISELHAFLEPGTLALKPDAADGQGAPADLQARLQPRVLHALERLLQDVVGTGSEPHVIAIAGEPDSLDPLEFPSTEQIIAKLRRELPARQAKRRIRWQLSDLQRVQELAEGERGALARLAEQGDEDHAGAIDALDRIAETAERLIAARRRPGASADGPSVDEVQVAYLYPVEVVVDLEDRQVTQVVIIDEAIEIDPEEPVRSSGGLEPVTPARARAAVAIAEREGGEWPASRFGW
jgi:hypothetical protein